MKFLGIDPGKRYIGLAMADDQVKIAMPYQVLDMNDHESLFKELEKIVAKEKIQKIIVGYPIGMSGKPTEQTKITEQFIRQLKKQVNPVKSRKAGISPKAKLFNRVNIPIIRFDERLSSKMADKLSSGQKQNHAVAANIILQDYLDKN
ncbi:Holliday junction resolvase RuvX [Patescibacteria group bacterium]|nr:Holliday junction resolvase RuvX [Patescibacteria group bacterium]